MTVDVRSLERAGRALAAEIMSDWGRLSHPGVGMVVDPATGDATPGAAVLFHAGPCRIRMPGLLEHEQLVGDKQITVVRMVARFPATIPLVQVNDLLDVDSTDPLIDSLSFRVSSVAGRSVLMYRELGLEVVSR